MHRLLETHDISVEVDADSSRKAYRTMSDTPAVFVEEMCDEVPYEAPEPFTKAKGYLTAEEAYRAYKLWCQDARVTPVSANRFGRAMQNLGFEKEKDEQVRSYRGLQFKPTTRELIAKGSSEPASEKTVRTDSSILPVGKGKEESSKEKTVLTVQSVRVILDDIDRENFPSKRAVIETIKMVNPMMAIEDLHAAFPGEPRIDQWIQELKTEGAIFEPRNGFLKVLE